MFDEIVAFAELEKFIDMQVRHYSSGMYVRLGFAVAVNVDPDILLVDEVLSVGDEAFQRKCLERVKLMQDEGRTILFVTHAADLVRRVCDRAVVLDHGRLVVEGVPGEAVRVFRESLHGGELSQSADDVAAAAAADEEAAPAEVVGEVATPRAARATHKVRITNVEFEHPGTLEGRSWLLPDEPLSVRVSFDVAEPTDDVQFGIAVHHEDGRLMFGTNTSILGIRLVLDAGPSEFVFGFEHVPLLDGTYMVTLAAQSTDEGTVYDWLEQRYSFSVMNPARTTGVVSFPVAVSFDRAG